MCSTQIQSAIGALGDGVSPAGQRVEARRVDPALGLNQVSRAPFPCLWLGGVDRCLGHVHLARFGDDLTRGGYRCALSSKEGVYAEEYLCSFVENAEF
jgi:hypothetical protein